jgi:hypothetical protein
MLLGIDVWHSGLGAMMRAMRHLPLLGPTLLVACSSTSAPLPTSRVFWTDSPAADSAAGTEDSAAEDTASPGDPPDTTEAVVCADPGRRAIDGPFEPMVFPDIALQGPDEELDMTNASGLAVGDLDGDGLLDILLPQAGPPVALFQQSDGSFVDRTDELWSGATDGAPGSAALHLVDIDGDTDLDVFLCGGPVMGAEPGPIYNQLFLNDGTGVLDNVSEAWGLQDTQLRACFGAAFGDIDGDGDLDMAQAINQACVKDFETGEEDCDVLLDQPSSQVLWENQGDRFVDISDRLPHETLLGSFAHVVTLLDFDGDLDLDLYITNDDKREISFSESNLLFENDGTGHFSLDDSAHGLDVSVTGMGLAVTDDNGDGLPDILLSSTGRLLFMVSDGERGWYEASVARGLVFTEESRIEPWSVDFVDIDHDTDLDVPVTFGYMSGDTNDDNNFRQPDAFFENDGERWVEVAAELGLDDRGVGRGLVVADLDGDGWLDILKRELGGTLVGYRSVCGTESWGQLRLKQPGPNPHAIGAVVTARFGDHVQRKWVLGGGTAFASNAVAPLHFGLGDAEAFDEVRVTWPDGAETVWTDLPARRVIGLERGD